MTPEEQNQLIQSTLAAACERVGVDAQRIKDQIAVKVFAAGNGVEVVPVDPITGHRRLSLRADRTWQTVAEAVEDYAAAHPEIVTAARKPAGDTIAGVPRDIFDTLNPTARLTLARKAGITARPAEKPMRREPTPEEAETMRAMTAMQKLRFARDRKICS